ncbi:MAG: plastocyanin/azurin family copper-binding protein [Candidatus Spechtbacterales bacterium]
MKNILITFGVLVVLVGAYFLFGIKGEDATLTENTAETSEEEMMAEDATEEEMMDGDMIEDTTPADETTEEPTAPDTEEPTAVKVFELEGNNFRFSKNEIRVNKGDTVRIVLTSADMPHNWVVDELGVRTDIVSPGEQDTIEFVAEKAGTFEYYCSVGNHRALGMIGTLIVE